MAGELFNKNVDTTIQFKKDLIWHEVAKAVIYSPFFKASAKNVKYVISKIGHKTSDMFVLEG